MSAYGHPAFAPYLDLLACLQGRQDLDTLNAAAQALGVHHAHSGAALRFMASASMPAAQYEQSIAASGRVPTREDNLHDFLNALVWLRFPQLKSALNLRHCQTLENQPLERRQRGCLRDQLTLLDESGMLVISADARLLDLLREKKWTALFWEARNEVIQHMRFIVIGHGLLEKCLTPFPGMTAKCLFLNTTETELDAIDRLAAAAVRGAQMLQLPPLPVQGVPGWDGGQSRAYYENTAIFRPARAASP